MTPSSVGELRGRSQGTSCSGGDGAAHLKLKKKKKKLEPWQEGAHRDTVDQRRRRWRLLLQPRNCGCII